MEISILVGLVTLTFVALLWGELVAAIQSPTPAGSVFLISVSYLIGATLVEWREGTETALFVYSAYALQFIMYVVGYFALSYSLRLRQRSTEVPDGWQGNSTLSLLAKWAFLVLVLGASLLVVYFIGADRLLVALYRFVALGDTDDSVLELRMGFASGDEGWLAPGYVKQLRDVLLPLATLMVLFSIRRGAVVFLFLAFTLIPIVSTLMISSGQRAPVLLFLIAVMYAAKRAVTWNLQSLRVVAVPAMVVTTIGLTTFLALTTSFSSRYKDDTNVLVVLADRVVTRVPEENVFGAPVWSRGAPFPGAGWLSELASVLPGTQKTLSNLVHEHLGGRASGNSVMGAWVGVHYNFGWSLGTAVSVLLGFFMALFNYWVNVSRKISFAADICGLWISICMLMVLSPFGFLLYGPFVTSAVLAVIVLWRTFFLRSVFGQGVPRNTVRVVTANQF
jgi:hypothetical protein